jgi:MFS family permease
MASHSDAGVSRLGVLLAMAMFVFVIDTSLMNVSISAVVRDLDTTVSGVQTAVALEALVSAAFILIGSKLGDLFGRKRAYVVGLVLYALGALAMVVGHGLAAIIVFWAVVGGQLSGRFRVTGGAGSERWSRALGSSRLPGRQTMNKRRTGRSAYLRAGALIGEPPVG